MINNKAQIPTEGSGKNDQNKSQKYKNKQNLNSNNDRG